MYALPLSQFDSMPEGGANEPVGSMPDGGAAKGP